MNIIEHNWGSIVHFTENRLSGNQEYHIKQVIKSVWVKLNDDWIIRIQYGMILVITLLIIKYNNNLWDQLIQNNNQDLLAIMSMLLPFIKDDSKRADISNLEDLYIAQDKDGNFIYTNSQYNRCIRGGKEIVYRPYLHEYFFQHLDLLLSSISQCAHKLYVNWSDVIPVTMADYESSDLFLNTREKLRDVNAHLVKKYHDISPGLPYHDIYNTISNYLFSDLKNIKWLMYDINHKDTVVTYLEYMEEFISLNPMWNGISWDLLLSDQINTFENEWKEFIGYQSPVIDTIYNFIARYFDIENVKDEDLEENKANPINANKIQNISAENAYTFLLDQLTEFKETWFYYTKVSRPHPTVVFKDVTIRITPKTFYNFAKSLVTIIVDKKLVFFNPHWTSLQPSLIQLFLDRLKGKKLNEWFSRSRYYSKMYPAINRRDHANLNRAVFNKIIELLPNVVFEIMIIKGLLSSYVPSPQITDDSRHGDPTDLVKVTASKQRAAYDTWLKQPKFKDAYYWLTGKKYEELDPWFEQIGHEREQDWIFTYAMNWISQLNFFHHFANTRVMFVTGSTGVGKSTQVPKLAMYAKYMLHHIKPKVACSQPRIDPTTLNAKIVALQLGVPIVKGTKTTSNYYVQYEYEGNTHSKQSSSFLRFLTDGKLYMQIRNSPFVTKKSFFNQPKEYMYSSRSENIYDIVIVDEAHEHNPNMDLILTLMRDAVYINNNLTLIIVSATMDDDEPIYRRYYRGINDNRSYPINYYIYENELDRANVDRRVHINPPGKTTRHQITVHYLETDQTTPENYLEDGIEQTLRVINSTNSGDLLLFVAKTADVTEAVERINKETTMDILALPFHGNLTEEQKEIIRKIHLRLPHITRMKDDVMTQTNTRRVQPGTYKRAVIVATNIAEASISLPNLEYVIDTGYVNSVVYDPLNDISAPVIVPISNTSSEQRKGRVGRVKPGTVYFRYPKSKVEKNKTSYGIADSDIKFTILNLTQTEKCDVPIINQTNDINNIVNISKMEYKKLDELSNPLPYIDIIRKQYTFTGGLLFYPYFGVHNGDDNDFRNQHDDYNYQAENPWFESSCYTGYRSTKLIDNKAEFFIIHPDENIMVRDITGRVISLKNSPLVSDGYYHYLITKNNVKDPGVGKTVKINYGDFKFLKVFLAYVYLSASLFVTIFYNSECHYYYKYPHTNKYQNYFRAYAYEDLKCYRIKTTLFKNLENLYQVVSYKNISNYNDLLWYAYGMSHGVQDIILAMIIFLNQPLSSWFTNKSSIPAHVNKKSDLYLFYDLWKQIEPLLPKENFSEKKLIFEDLKRRYKYGLVKDPILDELATKGKLDFGDYVDKSREAMTLSPSVQDKIKVIARLNGVNEKLLVTTAIKIAKVIYDVNVNLIANKPEGLDWILNKLKFSSIIENPTEFDIIIQQYIRAYSTNLIKSYYDTYTGILSGLPLFVIPWTRTLPERTLLKDKPLYLIYHNTDGDRPEYLTAVPLDWYVKLNPIMKDKTGKSLASRNNVIISYDEYINMFRDYTRMFNNYDYFEFIEKMK